MLAYHNVVPAGETAGGDRSLHLPETAFARQLDELLRSADVVPLEALAPDRGAAAAESARRPRVAITFDDAYVGAVTVGLDALARRGLPATVFVAPGLLEGRSFWWDALGDGLDEPTRRTALETLRGEDAAIREWAARHGRPLAASAEHARGATLGQLRRAVERGGVTLGAHTWSHPNLAAVDEATLRRELGEPLPWLRQRFPEATIPWLAYPYGLESPAARRVAAESGYRGAFRVDGGWLRPGEAPFGLPRLNVPAGLSLDGFRLRLAGVTTG